MINPNISRYYNKILEDLYKKVKQQRYNARRSAKRVGYSQELIDEYLPTKIALPDLKTIETREEARLYAKSMREMLRDKDVGYKGSELNIINRKVKQEEKIITKKIDQLEPIAKDFVHYYNQGLNKGKKIEYSMFQKEEYGLPFPEYKNVAKFKKQVSKIDRRINIFDQKNEQLRSNIIQSIDTAMSEYASELTPDIEEAFNEIKEKMKNFSNSDIAILSRLLKDSDLVAIAWSGYETLMISKDFLEAINSYEKYKKRNLRS